MTDDLTPGEVEQSQITCDLVCICEIEIDEVFMFLDIQKYLNIQMITIKIKVYIPKNYNSKLFINHFIIILTYISLEGTL